jgi:membrane associated rhomboid family serine protease
MEIYNITTKVFFYSFIFTNLIIRVKNVVNVVIFIVVMIVMGFNISGIDQGAHVGGLVTGWLFLFIFIF